MKEFLLVLGTLLELLYFFLDLDSWDNGKVIFYEYSNNLKRLDPEYSDFLNLILNEIEGQVEKMRLIHEETEEYKLRYYYGKNFSRLLQRLLSLLTPRKNRPKCFKELFSSSEEEELQEEEVYEPENSPEDEAMKEYQNMSFLAHQFRKNA